MGFSPGVSGNPRGRPRGSRNTATRAVAEWTAAILEDEQVQARLLSDARQGRLHHAVLGQLLLYAYGRPATSSNPEGTIPFSALADARASLRVKLDQMRDVLETESTRRASTTTGCR